MTFHPFAGEDERALAAAAAAFARDLRPGIAAAEAAGRIPPDVLLGLAQVGVLGMTAPVADGGIGASTVALALVIEEIAAVWPSLAIAVSVNEGNAVACVSRWGTPEQRARWMPVLRRGDGLGAFSLSEPDAGSDAAAIRTTAVRDGDGWRLRGRKAFVTSARDASLIVLFARVGEPSATRRHAGITAFLVPNPSEGLHLERAERKMGLRASDTSPVTLDDVRLGPDALLGEVGAGFGIALACLEGSRIGIAAQAVGAARGALERATKHVGERKQFGQPLASFGAVGAALARAHMEVDAARLLTLRAAWLRDRGQQFMTESSMAKLYSSEAAERATHTAVQLLGGYGYLEEYEVERFARDARATAIYEGTSEIQRMLIARGVLQ